ncbi:MAG TPA: beta-N-acetylhexosaminidase [Myxococcota bacterium]|nr:beta-N-acetylhexosaminidase [Myxococcota bacterium]
MIASLAKILPLLFQMAAGGAGSAADSVDEIIAGMTVEQKVGQLIMVGLGGKQMSPAIANLLTGYHIGSVALYGRNIVNTKQLARLIGDIRKVMRGEVQPFVAIDQEGGNVVRVRSDVIVLPGAMALGATRDTFLAFLVGQASAIDLGLVGIDMNLAPVLDINRNPHNPVINIRAYGDKPELVARLGLHFIQGQQQAGMATVAKHFPGHGSTARDSHFSLPVIRLDREQLTDGDLLPFRRAIAAGLDAVMTAHVRVPAIDPSSLPASLSHKVIGGLLRKELGFDGLVITDDLEMRAIANMMPVGQAAVKAIQAGADVVMVIWTAQKKREVFKSLLEAAGTGAITQTRLDESVRRILRLKFRRRILHTLTGEQPRLSAVLPNPMHAQLARTIARRAVTLVRNTGSLVPLHDGQGVLAAGPQRVFLKELKRQLPGVTVFHTRRVPSSRHRTKDLNDLIALGNNSRVIVVAVVNAYQAWLVQRLYHQVKVPIVVVSFGSPYFIRNFPGVAAYLCTYSYLPAAQKAAALALSGKISITGRLPATLSGRYQFGQGLVTRRRGH